jgi:PAS domain-containing protein
MAEARDYSDGPGLRLAGAMATLATLVAGAVLAAVVAWWAWQLFGPKPVHIAPRAPDDPVATLLASGMFDGSAGTVAAGGAETTALSGDAQLLGIIAGHEGDGYALFRVGSAPKLVAAGEAITGSATLVSVSPRSVTVREGGRERDIALWPRVAPAVRGAQPVASAAPPVTPTCAPPPGFAGPVIRLNAELLGGLAGQPSAWSTLLAGSPDGLVVRASGGYAAMLGLSAGDRIEQANGIALHAPDDVASAVLRPLTENQGVRLRGTHDGHEREVWVASASCAG